MPTQSWELKNVLDSVKNTLECWKEKQVTVQEFFLAVTDKPSCKWSYMCKYRIKEKTKRIWGCWADALDKLQLYIMNLRYRWFLKCMYVFLKNCIPRFHGFWNIRRILAFSLQVLFFTQPWRYMFSFRLRRIYFDIIDKLFSMCNT